MSFGILVAVVCSFSVFHRHGQVQVFVAALLGWGVLGVLVKAVVRHAAPRINAALAGPPFNGPLDDPDIFEKFVSISWHLFFHLTSTVWALYLMAGPEPWFDRPEGWCGLPGKLLDLRFSQSLHLFYITHAAVRITNTFTHRFMEKRRNDYMVMNVHHLVTLAAILISHMYHMNRAGLVVLYLHDASDVVIEVGKVIQYLRLEGRRCLYLAEIWFTLIVVSWAYFRLYLFPTKLFPVAWSDGRRAVVVNAGDSYNNDAVFWAVNLCLWSLALMHLYWFTLILRIGVRKLSASETFCHSSRFVHDDRSTKGKTA